MQEDWKFILEESYKGDTFSQYYESVLLMPKIPLSYWGLKGLKKLKMK